MDAIVTEQLDRWWWRASLGEWETYGLTRWHARWMLRLRYGLA